MSTPPEDGVNDMAQAKPNPSPHVDEADAAAVWERMRRRKLARRRLRLLRMVGVPLLAATALVLLVLVLRDFTNRNDRLAFLRELHEQVQMFEEKHGRLPTTEQVNRFSLAGRVSIEAVVYEADRVLPDSPHSTILAYTPELDTTFVRGGHAILTRGGNVAWVSPEELQNRLLLRDQHYRYNYHLGTLRSE